MTADIRAPKMPSRDTFQRSIMAAETSVAVVIMASKRASEPEAIRASLSSCNPLRFTYVPNINLVIMATMTTTSVVAVYVGVVGSIIFLMDSTNEEAPATITITATMNALKYSMRPKPKGVFAVGRSLR